MRARATSRGMVIGLQLAILVAVIALWEVGTGYLDALAAVMAVKK